MKLLLIDTCGATGSVAIADTGSIVASATLPGRSASERLVATVRELAATSGIGLSGIGAIAVVHGPGSFTGVRVGLSAAKGLCEALGVPLVAISRLAVLASMAGTAQGERVWAVLDAGRGEFYCGEYMDGERVREALLTREELVALVRGSVRDSEDDALRSEAASAVVACEEEVAEALRALTPRMVAEPSAEHALGIAMRKIERGEFDDAATVDANYLRRTDLEIFAKVVRASAAAC